MNNNSKNGRDIPEQLKRDVLVEAGHRCAIPTCRQTTVEIAHIVPWETVREHTFDNLIALCPTCHDRYDKKKEIDRKSMIQYKTDLSKHNQQSADSKHVETINLSDHGSYTLLNTFDMDPLAYRISHKIF